MINLDERMLPTSVGIKPGTSWSPVGGASNCSTEAALSIYLKLHSNCWSFLCIKLSYMSVSWLFYHLFFFFFIIIIYVCVCVCVCVCVWCVVHVFLCCRYCHRSISKCNSIQNIGNLQCFTTNIYSKICMITTCRDVYQTCNIQGDLIHLVNFPLLFVKGENF